VTQQLHLPNNSGVLCRVANLAFLKPDFEILAFFNVLDFSENQKSQSNSAFFFIVRKGWLWQNIV